MKRLTIAELIYPYQMLAVWSIGLGLTWWVVIQGINLIGICWGGE